MPAAGEWRFGWRRRPLAPEVSPAGGESCAAVAASSALAGMAVVTRTELPGKHAAIRPSPSLQGVPEPFTGKMAVVRAAV